MAGSAILACVLVGAVGILIGLLLTFASKKFQVEVDEREVAVRELLPGNNCGGCGYAGCDALAKAIAAGQAPVNQCPVGGAAVGAKIAEVMGVEAGESVRMAAFVKCSGTCDKAEQKYNYYGADDCLKAVTVPGGGDKACSYGCLGLGSCVKVCEFDGIRIVGGVAVVNRENCRACGKCVSTCPKKLIELIPYEAPHIVRCASQDKGPVVRKICSAGCIGCTMCVRNCPQQAVSMDGNVAKIDYSKCTGCGICAEKCPVHVII